jgi:hypothetical protein
VIEVVQAFDRTPQLKTRQRIEMLQKLAGLMEG